jgi:hypothetical protein
MARTVSTGLCEACFAALSQDGERAARREIIQAIDAPILLMQSNPRVALTANDRALALFGRRLDEAEGRRGGEVFGCVHSFTEAGCGRDSHCDDCRIKEAIVSALTGTGASAAATLTIRQDADVPYALEVSAENAGDFALVRIDRFEKERPTP